MSSFDPNMGGSQNYGSGSTGTMTGNTGTGNTGNQSEDWKTRVSDTAQQAREKANEYSRTAVDKLDQGRSSAASALQRTASSLRGAGGEGRMGDVANRAAEKIEHAATYMRDHDVRDMMSDVEGAVRRNPGPSLVIAAAFGFLLGSAIRGGSSSNRYRY
jgi:ElaB/YqjD/DUF883 family membrane-anchored ribosome-binding protein